MWIYMSDSMLSIVQNTGRIDQFLVRARLPGDIERVFPEAVVYETNDHDYRFRAFIDKYDVINAMLHRMSEINYPNFKKTVTNPRRHRFYANTHVDAVEAQRMARLFPNEPSALKPPAWNED